MKEIVYEDDYIIAVFKKGSAKDLVVTFGDMANLANGVKISAEIPLSKHNYNILGLSAKKKNWYPESSFLRALGSLEKIIRKFERVICYGGSMGGYAAIKYSRLLGVNKVIAFVPQYSINPETVKDRRYSHYFDNELHKNMDISISDIDSECRYTIVCDPYYKEDMEHVNKLIKIIDNLDFLKLRYSEHAVTYILANSDLLGDFINENICLDLIYRKMRIVKRSKEIYIESFLKKAIKQKGLFLLNLMMKSNQEMKINSLLKAELISLAIRLKVLNNDILEKLNIEKFNYDDSTLISMHKSTLVFNMLTNRLECYDSDAIANYGDYLAPVSKKLGVLSLSHRNQHLNIFTDKLGGLIAHDDADAPPANYLPLILNTKDGYLFISSSDGLVVSAWPNGNIDIRKTEIKAWEMFYTN